MNSKLQKLIAAVDTSGGRFAHIHGYTAKSGIVSTIVELRVGATYAFQLQQAITKSDLLNEKAISEKYGIDIVDVQQCIRAKVDSWNKSLEGTHKKKADYTTTLGSTSRGIAVVKAGKDNESIIITGYKLFVRYDESTLPESKPIDGVKRFKKYLDSFVAFRPYTLRPDNFEKVSIQGMTITPEDVFSMLEELRATA